MILCSRVGQTFFWKKYSTRPQLRTNWQQGRTPRSFKTHGDRTSLLGRYIAGPQLCETMSVADTKKTSLLILIISSWYLSNLAKRMFSLMSALKHGARLMGE